jgi:hypothetical protein
MVQFDHKSRATKPNAGFFIIWASYKKTDFKVEKITGGRLPNGDNSK